jgi:hypothetical protein
MGTRTETLLLIGSFFSFCFWDYDWKVKSSSCNKIWLSLMLITSNWIMIEQFCIFKIFKMSVIFKMAAKTRHKKSAVEFQHCLISSTFDMWVDNGVPNWLSTLKNFYRSPLSKWPPQYRKNSTLSDIIKFDM